MIPRLARLLSTSLVVSLAVSVGLSIGCATMGPRPERVSFRVQTNVPDATIWIDDHLVGTAADLAKPGQTLAVGFHRVEIRHPAYYSFFQEVEPKAGAGGPGVVIQADLHELVQ